jgi:hypothetical protein
LFLCIFFPENWHPWENNFCPDEAPSLKWSHRGSHLGAPKALLSNLCALEGGLSCHCKFRGSGWGSPRSGKMTIITLPCVYIAPFFNYLSMFGYDYSAGSFQLWEMSHKANTCPWWDRG